MTPEEALDDIQRIAGIEYPTLNQRRRVVFLAELVRGDLKDFRWRASGAERKAKEAERRCDDLREQIRAMEGSDVREPPQWAEMRRQLESLKWDELRRVATHDGVKLAGARRKCDMAERIIRARRKRWEEG